MEEAPKRSRYFVEELKQQKDLSLEKDETKAFYDKMIMYKNFVIGQTILLFLSCLKLFPGKLRPCWVGPYGRQGI